MPISSVSYHTFLYITMSLITFTQIVSFLITVGKSWIKISADGNCFYNESDSYHLHPMKYMEYGRYVDNDIRAADQVCQHHRGYSKHRRGRHFRSYCWLSVYRFRFELRLQQINLTFPLKKSKARFEFLSSNRALAVKYFVFLLQILRPLRTYSLF